ncbi:MAG: hypothetical protein JWO38_4136, partial [Gemmataceae bacterium]|nr:hypothetical protein [Gemmataceae bacterium]
LAALDAAGRTGATAATTRFALTRVQLRGKDGAVVGTDGKQLLVHRGFVFPWADDVLVARSGVFGVLGGLAPGPVGVGRTGASVWVAAGPWAVAVAVDPKGRFPDVVEVVPRSGAEATTLTVHPADADALRAALPTLPGVDEPNRPVTLDLGGRVVVRAAGDNRARPAEFVLARSRVDGRAVRVGCDRRHLAHALGLGFRVLRVTAPDQPVACPDGARTFVFMPLTADAVVEPAAGATRVRPPKPAAGRAGKSAPAGPGGPKSTPPPPAAARPPGGGGLVEEAVAVRDVLRATLGRLRAVIAGARRQRRQDRVVRSTLASLEQLKTRGG